MSYLGTAIFKTLNRTRDGQRYIDILGDNILGDNLVPSACMLGSGDHIILQDDVAPCHHARIVQE